MNFELSPEQEELRANVRRFLGERGHAAPLAELGLGGLLAPEALGGAGLGMLEMGVVLEEAGRALHAGPFVANAVAATRLLLATAAPEEQRALVPGLTSGARRAAVLGLAPGAALAESEGRVSGAERFVLEADGADVLLVATPAGVFSVDARAPGVLLEPAERLDLERSLSHVRLDAAPAWRLGAAAPEAVLAAADALTAGLVADGIGAAARALELAVEYAKQREQFGRPIGGFQAVQHLLVDMLQDLELTRAAAYFALWAQDAAPPAERRRATVLAKAFASEALPRVGAGAIQVFGGVGFTFEHDAHRFYRRLLSLSLLQGTAAQHYETLAALAFGTVGTAA